MLRGKWRVILIVLSIIAAAYYLYPTWRWYGLPEREQELARLVSLPRESLTDEQIGLVNALQESEHERYLGLYDYKKKALTLGLDLQGGMHLVLEVDRTGLTDEEAKDATSRAMEIIRNRVDQFGVAEPIIQKQGDYRIIVQLPGLRDETRAKNLIGRTALLEFKLLKKGETVGTVLENIDKALAKSSAQESVTDSAATDELAQANADTTLSEEAKAESAAAKEQAEMLAEKPFTALLGNVGGDIGVEAANRPKVERMLADQAVARVIPADAEFLWSSDKIEINGREYFRIYLVNKEAGLTGKYIADARPTLGGGMDPDVANKPIVTFSTTTDGAKIFSRLTGANIKERLGIVLDKKVYSAPTIESKLSKDSIIKGSFTMEEAKDLSIVLRAGALPAPIEVIEERTVGPSLGRDSIHLAKVSAVISIVLIAGFMIVYYAASGVIADFALFLNIVFILAVLAGFRATLTMPGIAGIILTIGMAVDANVLIHERIREELRLGKTIRSAIENGYSKAFTVIFDSNLTTILSSIVLYWQGTGPIKGFALTLIVGLLANMFTAVLVTRVIFDFVTSRRELKKLSI